MTVSPTPAPRPGPYAPPPAVDAPAFDPAAFDATAFDATAAGAKRGAEPSMGDLVSEASAHFSTLVRSEIELAKLELRASVKNAGVGIGLFGAAAVVLVFSLTFGLIALAEGLAALGLDRWLAFLIVFVLLLVLVGLLAFIGLKKVKRVKAPTRTITTSKETVAYLRSHG